MRFIKWVVNPEILLRKRFEGTTAWGMHLINMLERDFCNSTDNFINDPLVRVEVEGKARIAEGTYEHRFTGQIDAIRAHYFSMRTREALLVVLVRTRPYRRRRSAACYCEKDWHLLTMLVFVRRDRGTAKCRC